MPNENMKVITVMTRKGGAGKTMLTRALTSAAMSQGKKCLVLDADPQQALFRWAKKLEISVRELMVFQVSCHTLGEPHGCNVWSVRSYHGSMDTLLLSCSLYICK